MSRIYTVKKPPETVKRYYSMIFEGSEYTFDYYWYLANETRIWGCFVSKNGKLWYSSHQTSPCDMENCLKSKDKRGFCG